MIATASTEHSYWLAFFFVYATHATQAIAFEWKPGLKQLTQDSCLQFLFRQTCLLHGVVVVAGQLPSVPCHTAFSSRHRAERKCTFLFSVRGYASELVPFQYRCVVVVMLLGYGCGAVSYTHLTLPTIYSV